jgi:hypothetical protein
MQEKMEKDALLITELKANEMMLEQEIKSKFYTNFFENNLILLI